MQHPDEGTIHSWLDHALPNDEALRVEAHVAECAHCAAAVAEARGLIAAASRLLSSLDAADEPRTTPRATPRVGAEGTASGPRMGADGRGLNGNGGEPRIFADERGSNGEEEPRICADERGSIGVGGELQVAGARGVGERGRWSVWGRVWVTRVAAVLVVAAVGVVGVREMVGRGASKRVATAQRDVASVGVTAPKGPTASPRVTTPGGAAMPEGAAISGRAAAPERAEMRERAMKSQLGTAPERAPASERAAAPKPAPALERATTRVAAAKRAPAQTFAPAPDSVRVDSGAASAARGNSSSIASAELSAGESSVASAGSAARKSSDAAREGGVLAMQRENFIRGRVMSMVGQPVVHALVELRGTRFTTTTNEDGRYALVVPARLVRDTSAVVTVRRIGYQPASKAIALATDTAEYDFALTPSATALSEVVVTGMDAFTGRTALADSVSAASFSERRRSDSVSAARPAARPVARARADSVASRPDGATLTLVSRSTLHDRYGRAVRRSVYQVRPGVQVTVDAVRASDDQPPRDGAASPTQRQGRALAPDTTTAPAALAAGINSIQWTAEDSTRFTLSGPLPLAELRTLMPLVH